jgi:hypothetical protein
VSTDTFWHHFYVHSALCILAAFHLNALASWGAETNNMRSLEINCIVLRERSFRVQLHLPSFFLRGNSACDIIYAWLQSSERLSKVGPPASTPATYMSGCLFQLARFIFNV